MKVIMVNCLEAEKYEGIIWETIGKPYEAASGDIVVMLKGIEGCFAWDKLQEVPEEEWNKYTPWEETPFYNCEKIGRKHTYVIQEVLQIPCQHERSDNKIKLFPTNKQIDNDILPEVKCADCNTVFNISKFNIIYK